MGRSRESTRTDVAMRLVDNQDASVTPLDGGTTVVGCIDVSILSRDNRIIVDGAFVTRGNLSAINLPCALPP